MAKETELIDPHTRQSFPWHLFKNWQAIMEATEFISIQELQWSLQMSYSWWQLWESGAMPPVIQSSQNARRGKHGTAIGTLKLFCELNRVFLQDMAALAVLNPQERGNHPLYEDMPVLASPEFEVRAAGFIVQLDCSLIPLLIISNCFLPLLTLQCLHVNCTSSSGIQK